MTAFNPTSAAFEGFRLIRREFRSVLVWMLLWLAAFLFTAVVVATGQRVVIPANGPAHGARPGLGDLADRFGPFAAVSIAWFLLVWATTTVAAYRAVLRPQDRRFFFLRLGADELRLAIMTVASCILVLLFGGAPTYILWVLVNPIMRALPAAARNIATFGALATVVVEVWLGVRLSLIPVETFAERRFHLSAYWPLTRGRFWYLLACYFLCFLAVFGFCTLFFIGFALVSGLAQPDLGAGNLLRRTSILGLAVVLAALSASFWVISSTVFCACQAYAFRAIIGEGKDGVAIA
jgi:hypothetical protein